MDDKIQLLAEFRREIRKFLLFSERAATEAGLQPQQHQLLLQVAGAPEDALVTVRYLADALALRHHTVVELSKRCETGGLICRMHDTADRRCVVLKLTPKGHKALQQLSAIHAQELRDIAASLIPALMQIRDSKATSGDAPVVSSAHAKRGSLAL